MKLKYSIPSVIAVLCIVSCIPYFNLSWYAIDLFENGTTVVYVSSHDAEKLLNSKWIRFFPNLEKTLTFVKDKPLKKHRMTKSFNTEIIIDNASNLKVGGRLTAKIIAKDDLGRRKAYGGDFFIVMLRRPSGGNDGVLCEVTDETTGLYSVSCILPWSGKAILKAILIHPSESVLKLMVRYSTEEGYGYTMKAQFGINKRKTSCSVAFQNKRYSELCDFSNHKYSQPFKCIKPASGKCSQVTNHIPLLRGKLFQFYKETLFLPRTNFNVEIQGSGFAFDVMGPDFPGIYRDDSIFLVSTDPMKFTGWVLHGAWVSSKVRTIPHSLQRVEKCLKNKRMYFMGDSTIRQWYFHFRDVLKLKENTIPGSVWSQSRECNKNELNVTLYYRAHGPPLFNPGPPSSRPYIPDSIDNIIHGGEGTLVFITIGYHMEMHDPDVYLSRVRAIKKAIQSLFQRLPGAKVFVKGLHYHRRTFAPVCPTPWLTYRYDIILRNEFASMNGVTYFPTWDFTVLIDNAGLHPTDGAVKTQMELLMMYFC